MTIKIIDIIIKIEETNIDSKSEIKEAMSWILNALENMKDCNYRLLGSYYINTYNKDDTSELFYISWLYKFKSYLAEDKYKEFLHELEDFLRYIILKDNAKSEIYLLPTNIKASLIEIIKPFCKGE